MVRKPILYEKPQGVRDYLPHRANLRRHIEQRLAETYRLWGYEEIITPTYEYLETFQNGLRGQEDRVFKFIERSGKTVVLRPDMTAPIARVVSSLLKDRPLPLRLFYIASIFRQQEVVSGRDAEFTQAGIEHFGDGSPSADAEIIALAVAALAATSIKGFRVAIGQVAFLNAFLEEHLPEREDRQDLIQALVSKNFVEYESAVNLFRDTKRIAAQSAEALLWLQHARGGTEILAEARNWVRFESAVLALENLEAIWKVLQIHGVTDFVQLDLSLLPDLEYYTGCVLEGYAPGIGFPVVSGGRYDEMTGKFGRTTPATGFMIGVERILEVIERTDALAAQRPNLLLFAQEDQGLALSFCQAARKNQVRLACSLLSAQPHSDAPLDSRVIGTIKQGKLISEDENLNAIWQEWQLQRGRQK